MGYYKEKYPIVYPLGNIGGRQEHIVNDRCPECGGYLDTGWECNACGFDAKPEHDANG
jgi:uncharacterized protein (DUF983 family)